jgi:hypothetical protein
MIVGATDTRAFTAGEGSQYWYLTILWMLSSVLIIVHLLNMLIAIMGNTFSERAEVGSQIMSRDHLRFVIDNWILMDVAFKDKKLLKYIICAFQANDDDDKQEILTELKDEQNEMK